MSKITTSFAIVSIFLSFSPSAFASQGFDYYFGTILLPTQKNNGTVNNLNSSQTSQIAFMQARLNQMKATLATLNSGLLKPANINSAVAVAEGIPLLLEKPKKEEKNTLSVFASLIPPDVKNFPLFTTYFIILTLGIFGLIIYLYFTRKKEKKLF